MSAEWEIPFRLTTPYGVLPFNSPVSSGSIYYMLDPAKCAMGPVPLRVQTDDIPQQHGAILHREFKSGFSITLAIELWETIGDGGEPACRTILREMWDFLLAHVDALVNPSEAASGSGNARVQWTPSGYSDDRLVDKLQMLDWPTPTLDGNVTQVTLTLHSPFPYAIDLFQHDDTIAHKPSSTALINAGNTEFWPVFKVHGDTSSFTIRNETTGLKIHYDDTLPGASPINSPDYVEIDCFRNTMYLNGNQANMKVGLDVINSDFFSLVPGSNVLSYEGIGVCEILWNNSWVS